MGDTDLDNTATMDVALSSIPLWDDVSPIPQDEGPNPAVQIMYTPEFAETMDYFRAILQKDERSERALSLTERVIEGNAGNYTAWHFRRLCITALGSNLQEELEFTTDIALDSPKNYQIWYHRRKIVEMANDATMELDFTEQVLQMDSKNYHAWAHRQWAIETFKLWDTEVEFAEKLIAIDVRNNSAWNQRWFVVSKFVGMAKPGIMDRELTFALEKLKLAPNNESPCNYIRGLMRVQSFDLLEKLENQLTELRIAADDDDKVVQVVALLVDVYAASPEERKRGLACVLCDELGNKMDVIRKKYWAYRKDRVGQFKPAAGIRIAQDLAKTKIATN